MRSIPLLTLVVLSAGCGGKKPAAPPADAGPPARRLVKLDPAVADRLGVKVQAVGGAGDSRTIHVPGSLDYNLQAYAEVGCFLEGRVAEVPVKVGDRVRKGQLLATVMVPSVATAQADFVSARAAATYAREHSSREDGLLARNLTTVQQASLARSELAKAEAQLAAATARLRALRIDTPTGNGDVQAAGIMRLLAPLDGVVVARDAVVGKMLGASETAFAVADIRELWATLEVFETDMPYLRVGAEVELTVDAVPGTTFPGRLAAIEPHIGKTSRSVRARVAVPNPDGKLRPGYFVRAAIRIPREVQSSSLLVPATAIQPLGDDDVVFVARGEGRFEVRPVAIGRRTGTVAEVAEGLAAGEEIVVQGAFLLRGEVTRQ